VGCGGDSPLTSATEVVVNLNEALPPAGSSTPAELKGCEVIDIGARRVIATTPSTVTVRVTAEVSQPIKSLYARFIDRENGEYDPK
jgi:hypothetical protein